VTPISAGGPIMDYLYKEVGNGMNNDAEMRDREQIK